MGWNYYNHIPHPHLYPFLCVYSVILLSKEVSQFFISAIKCSPHLLNYNSLLEEKFTFYNEAFKSSTFDLFQVLISNTINWFSHEALPPLSTAYVLQRFFCNAYCSTRCMTIYIYMYTGVWPVWQYLSLWLTVHYWWLGIQWTDSYNIWMQDETKCLESSFHFCCLSFIL